MVVGTEDDGFFLERATDVEPRPLKFISDAGPVTLDGNKGCCTIPCGANVDHWIRRVGILEPVDCVSEKVHKRGRDVLTKTDQCGHLVRRYEIDECLVALEQFRGVAEIGRAHV